MDSFLSNFSAVTGATELKLNDVVETPLRPRLSCGPYIVGAGISSTSRSIATVVVSDVEECKQLCQDYAPPLYFEYCRSYAVDFSNPLALCYLFSVEETPDIENEDLRFGVCGPEETDLPQDVKVFSVSLYYMHTGEYEEALSISDSIDLEIKNGNLGNTLEDLKVGSYELMAPISIGK